MKKYEHLVEKKDAQYQQNDEKIWRVLKSMTVREVALSPVGTIAKEAGVGRNTLYKHRNALPVILWNAVYQEAERLKKIQEERKND